MTAGVGTGLPGQQLMDRIDALRALAAAYERDIRYLVDVLAERRERDDPWGPQCADQDQAPYMVTINPGRYL